MLAATMGSAPPWSGQEILKSGRRNRRGELRHAPLRDLSGQRLGRATVRQRRTLVSTADCLRSRAAPKQFVTASPPEVAKFSG
jgi:hypothetical protein